MLQCSLLKSCTGMLTTSYCTSTETCCTKVSERLYTHGYIRYVLYSHDAYFFLGGQACCHEPGRPAVESDMPTVEGPSSDHGHGSRYPDVHG
mmetsp:Transcript_5272/g.15650  ORF Transcript_5272/g.15650 Transcript_5272/m.15650 type:complete len:92 (+) Transcript_5272:224-499(+)